MPDVEEEQLNVAIAGGQARLTLTETFRTITDVLASVVTFGAETAVTARVSDISIATDQKTGPEIETLDSGGSLTAGHVNVIVRGY